MHEARNAAPTRLRGRIDRVFFASPSFSAGKLTTDSGDSVQFAGNLYAREHEPVVLCGTWIKHPKFGRQFKADCMEHDIALNSEGLIHYLANHPDIKGIGPSKARRIVETFGDAFPEVLENEPDRIADVVSLPSGAIGKLREEWSKKKHVNHVLAWLSAFGLTHHQVTTLVDKYGSNCLDILQADPYLLIEEIRGFGFKKVDLIARKLGTPKDCVPRIRAGVLHCVREALDEGHCWIEYESLIDSANTLLVIDSLDSRDVIEKTLDSLIREDALSCTSSDGRFIVALPAIHKMETGLIRFFSKASIHNPHFDDGDIEDLGDSISESLNMKQRAAVIMALRSSISMISGGAGVGKSYTVASINAICKNRDLHVTLTAPTGKAAKRLEEVSGDPGMTIHRLLGYDGKAFSRDKANPIDTDVLIVDEFSMVDVVLAWHLFEAIDLGRTSVVLVGDHNQLPPVGPGNILRDLIQTKSIPTVILDHVVRQAGVLKDNCTAILKGQVRKTSEARKGLCREWYLADQFTDPIEAQRFLLELFDRRIGDLGFDILRDVQVLTPTHKGPLGTRELNIALQRTIQRKLWNIDIPEVAPNRRAQFFVNDKVIQTRNNYDLNVMNGTIGRIMTVKKDGSLIVDFDGACVEIERSTPNFGDIQLAYALTIHKCQGSEFPCAIVVVHKSHAFMHHRNLFYTGVTRARQTAIVVGDRWGVANCAQRCKVDERRTFLSLLLQRPGSDTPDVIEEMAVPIDG